MAKVKEAQGSHGDTLLRFKCPGCDEYHFVRINQQGTNADGCWSWNKSYDYPTFAPSILVRGGERNGRCHSFVKNGFIEFLGDCTHDLHSQTVELPELEVVDEMNPGIANLLIEKWGKDPELQIGVPYRRMATEAAEIVGNQFEETDALIEMAFVQFAHLDDKGWYDTMSLSTLRDLGEYLVTTGQWERQDGGTDRRQFYRRKDNV